MEKQLVEFAIRYSVSSKDSYVLPALFERSAEKINMTAIDLVNEAMVNTKLGFYLAEAAAKVAIEDRKETV
ncbi:hypothetical protein FDI40_gp036 [Agrobacterium phage Atu_ph07]|uniref:Uncharacterized protein n=1 Tax=Agrobacterium phage Atu_ph07 TaxID=2024264 RepID=A0A2L0UZ91_9CAUD|nr:hypothetical protein FDI40_gp036 [Agrobacterium phage Atu_ph07]AUZ94848.1 hypothetical protein [Agrobacterium phage Atu_ph07]